MEQCVKSELTKSIGVSNFNIKQVKDILNIATIKPVVNQVMSNKVLFYKLTHSIEYTDWLIINS